MTKTKPRAELLLALAAAAGLAASPAGAQDSAPAAAAPVTIGPPQLKNFSLPGSERIVSQPPAEAEQEPAPAAAPVRPQEQLSEARQPAPPRPSPPERRAEAAAPDVQAPSPAPSTPVELAEAAPTDEAPAAAADAAAAELTAPTPAPQPSEEPASGGYWLFALPAAALAFLGLAAVRRRRRNWAEAASPLPVGPAAAPVDPKSAAPARSTRPWVELELKAERAQLTEDEAELAFELTLRNSGEAPARNVRVGARLFNAGTQQDKEIGSYFRTGSDQNRTFTVPEIPAGADAVIRGSVALRRDEIRPLTVQGRSLFVPMLAVNAFYELESGGRGQTARSFVVGREAEQPGLKMGPFRIDLGPRVWRSIGLRPHKLARRI